MENIIEKTIEFDRIEHAISLFGSFDENIKAIEEGLDVKIISRSDEIRMVGNKENVDKASTVIQRLISIASQGDAITKQNVSYLIQLAIAGQIDQIKDYPGDCVCLTARGKQIKAKTHGQKKYVD